MPTLNAMLNAMSVTAVSNVTKITNVTNVMNVQMNQFIHLMEKTNDNIQETARVADSGSKKMSVLGETAAAAADKMKATVSAALGNLNAEKVMEMADAYTAMASKLLAVNDGTQTQAQLQDKVFEAANRSRMSYETMADAVADMSAGAGGVFAGSDETIGFTELLQKATKSSSAGQGEQEAAYSRIAGAMESGGLNESGMASVMAGAPMVAKAIGEQMGVAGEELTKLAAQGDVTAEVIKNALFGATDEINEKFEELPMTFADVGQWFNNIIMQKFAPALEKINGILNSGSAKQLMAGFSAALDMAAAGADRLVQAFVDGDPIIKAALVFAIGFGAVLAAQMLIAAAASFVAYWPFLLIIGVIALVIFALNKMGVTFEDIFGGIGKVVGGVYAFFYNIVAGIWNQAVALAEFFANVFNNPLAAIVNLFVGWATNILDITKGIAEAIDGVFGTNLAEGLTRQKNALKAFGDSFKDENYISYEHMKMESKNILDTADTWGEKAGSAGNFLDDWDFSSVLPDVAGGEAVGTDFNPAVVEGTGNGGAVEVNMADEDMQYLRDLAQRDYVAKVANNTLAPNVRIEFTGPITESISKEKLGCSVREIMEDEIAAAGGG